MRCHRRSGKAKGMRSEMVLPLAVPPSDQIAHFGALFRCRIGRRCAGRDHARNRSALGESLRLPRQSE